VLAAPKLFHLTFQITHGAMLAILVVGARLADAFLVALPVLASLVELRYTQIATAPEVVRVAYSTSTLLSVVARFTHFSGPAVSPCLVFL
jgi:hypothetical protein